MFTLLVVFVVLYQNQVGRSTRRKKNKERTLGFNLLVRSLKTKPKTKKRYKKKKNKHLIP
jgi:hypothetical protein